ncbi:MAG: hypothetical protein ACYC2Y_05305 [Armatimonadota bacterium]
MRVVMYPTLLVLAGLLILDTNIGWRVAPEVSSEVSAAEGKLADSGISGDARLVRRIRASNSFRESRFFRFLVKSLPDSSYYAYTPVLSRRRIFIGEDFSFATTTGRASVLAHECAHLRWHRLGLFRGFLRRSDEANAYKRQYDTHQAVGLDIPNGGVVYWDMMIGVKRYVLPVYPAYAKRRDIRSALRYIEARVGGMRWQERHGIGP